MEEPMQEAQLKKYQKSAMSSLIKEYKKACRAGDMELVRFFLFSPQLSKNVDPFVDHCAGLRWACGNNQLTVVKFFLESEELPKPAIININCDETFRRACENGSFEVVEYLIQTYGDKINVREWRDYALRKSLAHGYLEVAQYLLFSSDIDEHCDINSFNLLNIRFSDSIELREPKPPKATYQEVLKFIFTDARLHYEIKKEDKELLFGPGYDVETAKYLLLDLGLKIKPQGPVASPEVAKIIDMIKEKDNLSQAIVPPEVAGHILKI